MENFTKQESSECTPKGLIVSAGKCPIPRGKEWQAHTVGTMAYEREAQRVCTALSVRDNLQIRKRQTGKTGIVITGRGKRDARKNLFLSS